MAAGRCGLYSQADLPRLFHFYIIREREGEEGDSTKVRLAKPTNFTDDFEMELVKRQGKYQIYCALLAGLGAQGKALRQIVKHEQGAKGA